MTTTSSFDGIIDAIIARLTANNEALGFPIAIIERDEPPAYIDELPCIYIVPLQQGVDSISHFLDQDELQHDFIVTLNAYYKKTDLSSIAIRSVRGYAFTIVDLFKGNQLMQVGDGYIYHDDLELGYWMIVDTLVYRFKLDLSIRAIL